MKTKQRIATFLAAVVVGLSGVVAFAPPAHAATWGPFLVQNASTGLCLDSYSSDLVVRMRTCDAELSYQQWKFVDTGSPFQYWILDFTPSCMTPYGLNTGDGVIQTGCDTGSNYQKWTTSYAGTDSIGPYYFIHSDWSNLYLAHPGWVTPLAGAGVRTICSDFYACNGWPAWRLWPL